MRESEIMEEEKSRIVGECSKKTESGTERERERERGRK